MMPKKRTVVNEGDQPAAKKKAPTGDLFLPVFNTKYGFGQYCPTKRATGENDGTIASFKKLLVSATLIDTVMQTTFPDRRWEILQGQSIADVMTSYPVLKHEEEFWKEYERMRPPYKAGVILGKVNELMPTLLSISKCKGDMERCCRLASDSAADPDRGSRLTRYASVFSLLSLLEEKEDDLISNKEKTEGAPYIRTNRPVVQLPEEDTF